MRGGYIIYIYIYIYIYVYIYVYISISSQAFPPQLSSFLCMIKYVIGNHRHLFLFPISSSPLHVSTFPPQWILLSDYLMRCSPPSCWLSAQQPRMWVPNAVWSPREGGRGGGGGQSLNEVRGRRRNHSVCVGVPPPTPRPADAIRPSSDPPTWTQARRPRLRRPTAVECITRLQPLGGGVHEFNDEVR